MANIDCNSEMTNFHRDNVTLGVKQQNQMRVNRNAGRTRLENGLNEAGKPQPEEVHSQGSYQMRTMVQDDKNDYDIDDGAYFACVDLTDNKGNTLTPLEARERVCSALKWDGRLKKEAMVKRNCVRQEYAEGHHIDIPVYRIVTTKNDKNEDVTHYELASGNEWVKSDARGVTSWYNGKVGILNAGESDGSQMRRVTKLTKKFARRQNWKLKTTSGICITKLVVDNFKVNTDRDDKALRETWKAIDAKLQKSTEIDHPVLDAKLASAGDAAVTFFRYCLSDALKTLEALDKPDCTRKQAREAWDNVFDTDFFTKLPDNRSDSNGGKGSAMKVMSVETARRNDGGGRFG